MFSPDALPKVIEKIDGWTQEELAENINDVLPTLTTTLNKVEQKSLSLRSVHILLDRCITCVPISKIDSDILQHALPTAKDIFKEALEGITVVLQDAENLSDEEVELTLRSLHHVCFGLIDQLKNVVHTVSSFCPLSASKVPSVPSTILQLLWIAFTHCNSSEELYGPTREHLLSLFSNSQMLLYDLKPLLCSGLQFNLKSEEDEVILRNVLESLVCVAQSTTSLGVAVQTAAWTSYVHLVERYRAYRDLWSLCDVATPVAMLATSVSDTLSYIFDNHGIDLTVAVKALTILSFLVRVLTKLCSVFTSHLTETCIPPLYKLLELLLRSCVKDVNNLGEKSVLLQEAEKRVGVAASSLIPSLISDRSFVQIYFSMNQESIEAPFGKLLIGASVCRALVGADSETRKLWLSDPDTHIVSSMFLLMGCCHPELCSNVTFTAVRNVGKPTRLVDLYEHILHPVGALLLLVPPDGFSQIESLLVKNLTQSNHWRGIFAMDLWCIIARQSPDSVIVSHTTFLLELLSSQQPVQCSPTQIHFRMLLCRLWPLLPTPHQTMLLNKFPPVLMPEVWESVSPDTLMLENVPNDFVNNTSESIKNFLANPDVEAFKRMLKSIKFSVMALAVESNLAKLKPDLFGLTASLSQLWSLICNPLKEFMNEGWLSYFFSAVCDLTEKLCTELDNSQLIKIFKNSLDIFSNDNVSCFKLKILNVLHALAVKVFDCDSQQMRAFHALGNIFVTAIEDKNYIVQQEALSTFEYFAHVTNHEEIIKFCLRTSKTAQEKVTLYLKKTPMSIKRKTKGFDHADYLKLQNQVHYFHQCQMKRKKPSQNNILSSKSLINYPSHCSSVHETSVSESEIFNALQRLQKDSTFVSEVCKTPCLSKSTKVKLSAEMDKVMKSVSEICFLLKE